MDQESRQALPSGHSRREALKLGLAGLACAACGASGVYYVARLMGSALLVDVFKQDRPPERFGINGRTRAGPARHGTT